MKRAGAGTVGRLLVLALGAGALLLAATLACDGRGNAPGSERLEQVLLHPDALERAQRLTAVLAELGPDDLPGVRIAYRSLWRHLSPMDIVLFADWWGGFDPEAALEASRGFGDGAAPARDEVIRSWARRDPEAARQHLLGGERDAEPSAVVALVRGWAESSHPGAWGVALGLPSGLAREAALQALADHVVLHEGNEAATQWEASPPAGLSAELAQEAAPYFAGALVLRDPDAAGAWVARRLEAPLAARMVRHVAERWVDRSGAATFGWLMALPQDAVPGRLLESTFGQWLQRDADEALAWAAAQPPTPALEPVRSVYAVALSQRDPQRAAAVLETIHDPDRRNRTALRVGRNWLRRAPAAARSWLEETELDPGVREQILTPPRRRRPARGSLEEAAASAAPGAG